MFFSQAKQVFYVDDPQNLKWKVILISSRDIYNMLEPVMDVDGVLQRPSSNNADDVSDFHDLAIDNWPDVISSDVLLKKEHHEIMLLGHRRGKNIVVAAMMIFLSLTTMKKTQL